MTHPALTEDSVAVITGGASGIGFAIAMRLAAVGMKIAIIDRTDDAFEQVARDLRAAGAADVATIAADVTDRTQLAKAEADIATRFGGTDILINNAGIGRRSSCLGPLDAWDDTLKVNLWGAINGTQAFAPNMIARGRPGLIVNTGSKQGITTPPGNPAYNVSKAALKVFTESLAHELRNTEGSQISAHLLVPGFVHTPMIGADNKPDAAWTADQTAAFFLESVSKGDFYILCPDNDVTRDIDEKRIAWAAGDLVENRPPLSRWHPDYQSAFARFMEADD